MKTIQITKHPSVVQVQATGRTLKELFVVCALALATTLTGESDRGTTQRKTSDFENSISVKAVDASSLLIEWVTALIGITDMESVVLDFFEIDSIDETSLTSRIGGYHVETFVQPVSSINYESVKVEEDDSGFKAEFTLEL